MRSLWRTGLSFSKGLCFGIVLPVLRTDCSFLKVACWVYCRMMCFALVISSCVQGKMHLYHPLCSLFGFVLLKDLAMWMRNASALTKDLKVEKRSKRLQVSTWRFLPVIWFHSLCLVQLTQIFCFLVLFLRVNGKWRKVQCAILFLLVDVLWSNAMQDLLGFPRCVRSATVLILRTDTVCSFVDICVKSLWLIADVVQGYLSVHVSELRQTRCPTHPE